MMDRFVTLLAEGVERFGGTVDKFTGDGIMALFGAPLAYEDHARRGCLAALTMSSAVADYAAELRRTVGLGFAVRIGLNSGEVVTGGIAGGSYTAVGHTVGLAQRMEALAEPGRAYLTEATAELAGPYFALSDLGPHEVKGSPEPVRVFALDGVASRLPSTSVPLVGRDAEMAELEAALVRVEAGETLVVGVVGLAGVGKSRLCEEFAVRCTERNIMVRRAAGLAHATSVPMLPILELFRDYFGISIADSPPAARERIAGRLLLLDPAFVDDLPLVFDFLEVPDPQRPAPNLPPEARLRRIFRFSAV
jgi:adenylate cyclase